MPSHQSTKLITVATNEQLFSYSGGTVQGFDLLLYYLLAGSKDESTAQHLNFIYVVDIIIQDNVPTIYEFYKTLCNFLCFIDEL